MRIRPLFLTMLLLVSAAACAGEPALPQPLRIVSGLIAGAVNAEGNVTMFKGIPYAAPPVGELRWREPQPPAAWDGVRSATAFGACCAQPVNTRQPPYTAEFSVVGDLSEDCLFLNVWTPAKAATDRLAVMVYIHGGSGTHGSGSVAVYDGESLAKQGIIVVTVNFRLGPLAGLGHPELTGESPHQVSGNYGLLDMLAALRWVQHNIAAFGGDPHKVTLCGQSSGCLAVHYLTTSPLAKGLFRGVIALSFAYDALTRPTAVGNLRQKEQKGVDFAAAKKATSIAALRAIPATDLIAPDPAVERFTRAVVGASVATDGWLFPHTYPEALDRGLASDVPTITGFTHDDSGPPAEFLTTTLASFNAKVPKPMDERKDEFFALYPADNDAEAKLMEKQAQLDHRAATVFHWAKRRARHARTPVYTYRFDQPIPWPEHPRFGAFHSSDLIYAFDNLGCMDRPWRADDRQVAKLVSAYWVNFIKTGDPNGPGLPRWNAYVDEQAQTMVLGVDAGMREIAEAKRWAFLRALLDR